MIFNRYHLIAFFAGFQSLAHGASLRNREGRRLNAAFNELVTLLDETYDGSCTTHVAGTGVIPMRLVTYVNCQIPGGYAKLIGDGGEKAAVPKELAVCEIGMDNKSTCSTIEFTGNANQDIKKAEALLKGHEVQWNEYDWLVSALNATYGETCQVYTTGGGTTTTFVDCTRPGGTAYLVANGSPATGSPKVVSLEVCSYGAMMKEKCRTVKLTGDEARDKSKISKLFATASGSGRRELDADFTKFTEADLTKFTESGPIVGTDYDMLVELLNGAYHNKCEIEAVMGATYVTCSRFGGTAMLSVEGSTTKPQSLSLQVCDTGDDMKRHKCQTIDLTGDSTKDLAVAKKMVE
jgi:hypothetical protein